MRAKVTREHNTRVPRGDHGSVACTMEPRVLRRRFRRLLAVVAAGEGGADVWGLPGVPPCPAICCSISAAVCCFDPVLPVLVGLVTLLLLLLLPPLSDKANRAVRNKHPYNMVEERRPSYTAYLPVSTLKPGDPRAMSTRSASDRRRGGLEPTLSPESPRRGAEGVGDAVPVAVGPALADAEDEPRTRP